MGVIPERVNIREEEREREIRVDNRERWICCIGIYCLTKMLEIYKLVRLLLLFKEFDLIIKN